MKKKIGILLTAALCLGMLTAPATAAEAPSWAEAAVSQWTACGKLDENIPLEAALTRGELAMALDSVMCYREQAEDSFSDLSVDEPCADAILRLVKAEVLFGDSAGLMWPERTVTRQEAAVILARAFGLQGSEAPNYADAMSVAPWATDAVAALQQQGIMVGNGDKFYPQNKITYMEWIQALYRALEKTGPMTGLTVQKRDAEGVLAEGQPGQVNDKKFKITSLEKTEAGYTIQLQGLEPLIGEKADVNGPGEPAKDGKWMGLCLTFHGLVNVDELQYSLDGEIWETAGRNSVIAEELRDNSIMMYINGAETFSAVGAESVKENKIEIRQADGSMHITLTIDYTPANK